DVARAPTLETDALRLLAVAQIEAALDPPLVPGARVRDPGRLPDRMEREGRVELDARRHPRHARDRNVDRRHVAGPHRCAFVDLEVGGRPGLRRLRDGTLLRHEMAPVDE